MSELCRIRSWSTCLGSVRLGIEVVWWSEGARQSIDPEHQPLSSDTASRPELHRSSRRHPGRRHRHLDRIPNRRWLQTRAKLYRDNRTLINRLMFGTVRR